MRLLAVKIQNLTVASVYFPTSVHPQRHTWDDAFYDWIQSCERPFLVCGDFNVVSDSDEIRDINLSAAATQDGSYYKPYIDGCTERFRRLLDYVTDTYRRDHPTDGYTG